MDADRALRARYVRYPPKWRNVLVPMSGRRATAVGMTLYTASRPRSLAAHWVLWTLARTGGARLLPGAREGWRPEVSEEVLAAVWRTWIDVTGDVEGVAVYHRLQAERPGSVVLVCGRRRSMLVRLRTDPDELLRERQISEAASAVRLRSFRVPRLLSSGSEGGWHWTGYEVMSATPHAPARRLVQEAATEITGLVEQVVPRPPGTPSSWHGVHGDMTPWNLRTSGRSTWLIDWEDASWGPPGADEVYFAATRSALKRNDPNGPLQVRPGHEEARAFWASRVAARATAPNEQQLHRRLTVLLAGEDASR